MLALLAARFPSLKWSSKSFAALSHIRIFPAVHSDAHLPEIDSLESEHVGVVSLDVPCTLFQHASVAWTQLPLLHPDTFAGWPKPLLQRFAAIKDSQNVKMSKFTSKMQSKNYMKCIKHASHGNVTQGESSQILQPDATYLATWWSRKEKLPATSYEQDMEKILMNVLLFLALKQKIRQDSGSKVCTSL